MKAKISLVIIGVILLCSEMTHAEVIITLKNGSNFKWGNYTATNEAYCTLNNAGQFCVSKSDVISVKEIKDAEQVDLKKEPTEKVQSSAIPTKKQKLYYKTTTMPSEY